MYDIMQECDELINPRPTNLPQLRMAWIISWQMRNRGLIGLRLDTDKPIKTQETANSVARCFVYIKELHLADSWTPNGGIVLTQHYPRRYTRDNFPPNTYGQYPQQRRLN
jgi:hypothetical protein